MKPKVLYNGQKPKDPKTLLEVPQDLVNNLKKTWPSFKLAELNWHDFDSIEDHPDWETGSYTIFLLHIKHNEPEINNIQFNKAIQAWIMDQDNWPGMILACYNYLDKAIDLIFYNPL